MPSYVRPGIRKCAKNRALSGATEPNRNQRFTYDVKHYIHDVLFSIDKGYMI